MIGQFIVLLQAFTWALMNVLDAHIVKKHVKHVRSFIPVSGIGNILIALPLLYFFWDADKVGITYSILAGIFFGLQAILYYLVIEKEDVSHMIGVIYMYPLFGLIIGSFFLNETLQWINYVGCALTLVGVLLTIQRTQGKWKLLLPLVSIALFVAIQEAFQSVSADHINFFFASALQTLVMGLVLLTLLFSRKNRDNFSSELKNIKYAFLSEAITIVAVLLLVASYLYLPYVAVSFISVSQIIFVVLIEKVWSIFNPRIMQDVQTSKKLLAMTLVAIGVLLVMI